MSIQQLRDNHRAVDDMELGAPFAWVIIANPVWGRFEDQNLIAIFDTKEQAEDYERASRLPAPINTGGIGRTYRPDSLLYDYNPGYDGMIKPVNNAVFVWECSENPTPPSGDVPPMRTLEHARYGVDYDVGFGGPITDTSREVPR